MAASVTPPITTHRFVREDLRSLASYLDVALEKLEKDMGTETDAIVVLRRVRWHLAATPPRLAGSSAALAADQTAFLAPRRAATIARPRTELDPDALGALLRQAAPEFATMRIEGVCPLGGGRSKLMAMVEQSGCDALPPRFVFRQDWSSAITGTSVAKEFAIARGAHRAGIATPAPLFLCRSEADGNLPFMLLEFADGAPTGDLFAPPHDADLVLQLAAQLGRLHAVSVQPLLDAGVEQRHDTPAVLEKARRGFAGSNAALGQGSAVIAAALDAMPALLPGEPERLALVHGDLGFHNVLTRDGRLTALIDWEFSHCGYPAEDLGYIRGDVERVIEWDAFMAAYHHAGGPPIEPREIDFFQLWGLMRLYILLIQARGALRGGFTRDLGVARMCADWIPRLIAALDDSLTRIGCPA